MYPLLILLTLSAFIGCGDLDSGPRTITDPHGEFNDATGFSLPATAKVVAAGDTHGGFHGDGELYLVFKTDPATVQKWLDSIPPWKQTEWLTGPVPGDISGHCMDAPTTGMNSTTIKYVAEDFRLSSIEWHNGRLLVLNPETGDVTLSWWDF